MKKIFESFTDFYKSRFETINEDHLTPGTKVELTDGRFGTIEAWTDEEEMYTVSIEGETETVKVTAEEIEQEIVESNINEDHLTPGTKVELTDGRFGTIEAWTDEEEMYTVSIEGETETVKVTAEEIVDDEILEGEDASLSSGVRNWPLDKSDSEDKEFASFLKKNKIKAKDTGEFNELDDPIVLFSGSKNSLEKLRDDFLGGDGIIKEGELQDEYQKYFKEILDKYEVSSPNELDEEKKKEFFAEVKKGWEKGKGRKSEK